MALGPVACAIQADSLPIHPAGWGSLWAAARCSAQITLSRTPCDRCDRPRQNTAALAQLTNRRAVMASHWWHYPRNYKNVVFRRSRATRRGNLRGACQQSHCHDSIRVSATPRRHGNVTRKIRFSRQPDRFRSRKFLSPQLHKESPIPVVDKPQLLLKVYEPVYLNKLVTTGF